MKINDVLLELGAKYSIRVIDYERVIYRDFGSFDVEISVMRNDCVVYVWDKEPHLHIAEFYEVKSLYELKEKLAEIERRQG